MSDESEIAARCLIACREVRYEARQPDAPYSLVGVVTELRPRGRFPLVLNIPLALFVEYFGPAGGTRGLNRPGAVGIR